MKKILYILYLTLPITLIGATLSQSLPAQASTRPAQMVTSDTTSLNQPETITLKYDVKSVLCNKAYIQSLSNVIRHTLEGDKTATEIDFSRKCGDIPTDILEENFEQWIAALKVFSHTKENKEFLGHLTAMTPMSLAGFLNFCSYIDARLVFEHLLGVRGKPALFIDALMTHCQNYGLEKTLGPIFYQKNPRSINTLNCFFVSSEQVAEKTHKNILLQTVHSYELIVEPQNKMPISWISNLVAWCNGGNIYRSSENFLNQCSASQILLIRILRALHHTENGRKLIASEQEFLGKVVATLPHTIAQGVCSWYGIKYPESPVWTHIKKWRWAYTGVSTIVAAAVTWWMIMRYRTKK